MSPSLSLSCMSKGGSTAMGTGRAWSYSVQLQVCLLLWPSKVKLEPATCFFANRLFSCALLR